MKIIDGSYGEGGGQIFRTAITLAMCLGEPVRIENIRAGRKKPGLLRQHLACLHAGREICEAEIEGDVLGSKAVTFKPGKVKAGDYEFTVGTAGSTTLIFQTVMLPLLTTGKESTLCFSGGTHNGMAPSYEFIEKSFLPLMQRIGFEVRPSLARYGFYPAGGGQWRAAIKPVKQRNALDLQGSGKVLAVKAVALSSRIPRHVGERELQQVALKCAWQDESLERKDVSSVGPGNMLSLQLTTETCVNVFDAFGEKNVSAERVANKAIRMLKQHEVAQVAVGEHLADQLLLPLLCGVGGSFTTGKPSEHLLTNIAVVEQFVAGKVSLLQVSEAVWKVTVQGSIKAA